MASNYNSMEIYDGGKGLFIQLAKRKEILYIYIYVVWMGISIIKDILCILDECSTVSELKLHINRNVILKFEVYLRMVWNRLSAFLPFL